MPERKSVLSGTARLFPPKSRPTFGTTMGEQLQRIGSYLGHLVKARNRHGVHSPFVYDLIEKVLRPQASLPEHGAIEALSLIHISEPTRPY